LIIAAFTICVIAVTCSSCTSADPSGHSGFSFTEKADRLSIAFDHNQVADYVFSDPNILRPYFAHVRTIDGIQVTRHHPPISGVDPVDHATMHPGVWLAFGDISGNDFWRNKATIRQDKFTAAPNADKDQLTFATQSTLISTNGEALGRLDSSFILTRVREGLLLSWQATFAPTADTFTFGDQEEMGFGIRIATPISERNGGTVRNSDGLTGAKPAWGKTASWCDYSGILSNRWVGITVMSDPRNFRPSWFHSRDYGLIVANPFGQKAFAKGEPSNVLVKKGDSFSLRFAAFIHSSRSNQPPDIDSAYRIFKNQD